MKLSELQQNGGLAGENLVKRTGEWNGDSIEFYVRTLSFGDIDRTYNNADLDASQAATLIAKAVRLGDEGEESLTYQQAYDLVPSLAAIFADAVMTVNGVNQEAAGDPKASSPTTSSGSSSRKSSAAPSPKPASG